MAANTSNGNGKGSGSRARKKQAAATKTPMEMAEQVMDQVSDTLAQRGQTSTINVGETERYLSLFAGLGLVYYVLRNRGLSNLIMLIAGGELLYRGLTGNCPVYQAVGLSTAVKTNPKAVSVPHEQGEHVSETVIINRPVEDVYAFWRDFTNLPRFMDHLESVTILDGDGTRSHWVAKAPLGVKVEWDAEIVNEIRNEVIAWRSLPGAQIANAGAVRFTPAADGQSVTVRVEMEYVPPAGQIGVAVARLLGEEPTQQITHDLNKLKTLLEGEGVAS